MSRRWSGSWGREQEPLEPVVEVLIPTVGRAAELSVTLAGLAAQEAPPFDAVISDQSANGIRSEPSIAAMLRVLEAQGRGMRVERHLPRRGMAEQRNFLLESSRAKYVLFLDDDVWCEPGLLDAIRRLGCGFVGSAVQGLSFLDDERPDEQEPLEFFHGRIEPETIRPHTPEFQRLNLHNAANLTHIAAQMDIVPGGWRAYRVAWVGGCCLFNRAALVASGGFDFWVDLPPGHAGEDVVAQWRVMEKFGGAGILPSGAVHLEAPTTITDRNVEATDVVFGRRNERKNNGRQHTQPHSGAEIPRWDGLPRIER